MSAGTRTVSSPARAFSTVDVDELATNPPWAAAMEATLSKAAANPFLPTSTRSSPVLTILSWPGTTAPGTELGGTGPISICFWVAWSAAMPAKPLPAAVPESLARAGVPGAATESRAESRAGSVMARVPSPEVSLVNAATRAPATTSAAIPAVTTCQRFAPRNRPARSRPTCNRSIRPSFDNVVPLTHGRDSEVPRSSRLRQRRHA